MWAKQTVHAVLERCVVEVKNKDKDESYNTSTVNPIIIPNLDNLCPSDCNNNGTCKDGMAFNYSLKYRHICVYVLIVTIIKKKLVIIYFSYFFIY